MYPILYRRKTRTGFFVTLVLLALTIRLLCAPALRAAVLDEARSLLQSEALLKAVFLLETGRVPQFASPAAPEPASEASRTVQGTQQSSSAGETSPSSAGNEPVPQGGEDPSAALRQSGEPQPAETEVPAAPAAFTPAEAEAIRFRGNCSYDVDKAALLLRPLDWPERPGPKVLIIHSHSTEAYTQSEGHAYLPSGNYRTLDPSCSVIAVGDALAEELGELGVELIHDRTLNDYPSYNRSYAVAREKIQAYLEEYPSLVMVIDLHRDALDKPVRETVEREGRTLAPLMLVVGTDEGGLTHPHWDRNLSCGLKLQALANRDEPGLFKALSFRASRFNGDLSPGALIVEVGSTENTLEEACASMPYLARYVAELLRCE